MVRALASHQCGLGSSPGIDAICGLSLLLVLSFASGGFSSGTPVFPSPQKSTLPNSNSTWNARTRFNNHPGLFKEFLRTLKCSVVNENNYNLHFQSGPRPLLFAYFIKNVSLSMLYFTFQLLSLKYRK